MRFSLLTAATLLATLAAARPSLVSRVDDACPIETTPGDGDAGIGAEFETVVFKLKNDQCSLEDTWALKKKVIDKQQGTGFQLTVDTTKEPGILQPEIILDGRTIEVGKGNAATAGKDAVAMFDKWWAEADKNDIQVADSVCNPWKITDTKEETKNFEWDPQVTAPMPLEALYTLMRDQQAYTADRGWKRTNIINGLGTARIPVRGRTNHLVVATKNYFQESPNGMDPAKLDNDVLGFLSLVLSYAKAAHALQVGESPKLLITYMPRTDFNTMFAQVKARVPGDLFKLIEHLACYRTDQKGKEGLRTTTDKEFCDKKDKKMIPNGKLAGLKYTMGDDEMSVKKWIEDIQAGTDHGKGKDMLSKFDELNDGSIGGLGKRLENAYGTQRGVPLFEFRDLDHIKTPQIEEFMRKVDENVQKLHKGATKAAAQKRAADPNCRPSSSSTSLSASATKTSSSKVSVTMTSSSAASATKTTSSKASSSTKTTSSKATPTNTTFSKTTSIKTTSSKTISTKTTKATTETTKATTETARATTKTTKATTKTTKTAKPTKTKT